MVDISSSSTVRERQGGSVEKVPHCLKNSDDMFVYFDGDITGFCMGIRIVHSSYNELTTACIRFCHCKCLKASTRRLIMTASLSKRCVRNISDNSDTL